ncbi:MAG: acyl-CoA thioesterase [Saprospiraceae bacterium]|jgi:acyl-CoA thioesterase
MQNMSKSVFDKMMETDYFSQWLGIRLVEISDGKCVLEMTVRKEMLNGFAILHGGVTFAFADSAFAFASNSHNKLSVSLTASMTYSKPAKEGDIIVATAIELSLTNKTGTYDVVVSNKNNGETISLFRGTVYRTSREVR